MSEHQLAPFEPVKPLVDAKQAAQQWAAFEELKAKLLNDSDYATIQNKPYVTKSGFRKIAVFFGLSDSIAYEERNDREDGSFTWRIRVKATAPNGRSSEGVGVCDSKERRFAHVEHDVYATAHTRAKNRAISDLIAGGVVSAEEMETPPQPRKPVQVDAKPVEPEFTVTEETVAATLEANDLPTKDLMITKYGPDIRILPRDTFPQEMAPEYGAAIAKLLGGAWSMAGFWEVPA